jgi:Rap guanine nucleotide exchange factor 2
VAAAARFERHVAGSVLYYQNDLATSWFLILSGSVIAGADLYVSGTSFGNDVEFGAPREEDAVVLESSQFVVCCCELGGVKTPDIEIIDEDYLRKLIAPLPPKSTGLTQDETEDNQFLFAGLGHTRESSMSSGYSSPSALSLDSSVIRMSNNHTFESGNPSRPGNSCSEQPRRSQSMGLSPQSSSSESLSSLSSSIAGAPRSPNLVRNGSLNPSQRQHLSSTLYRCDQPWKPQGINNLDLIGAEMQHLMNKAFAGSGGGNICRHDSVLMTPMHVGKTRSEQKRGGKADEQQDITHNFDLDDLPESSVDSDEEDMFLDDSSDSRECLSEGQDPVFDALLKIPGDRTERDVELILEFVQNLPAFSSVSLGVRKALCSKVHMTPFEREQRVVANGRELNSWYVVFDGQLELSCEGHPPSTLYAGDTFGITAISGPIIHEGTLIAKTPCQILEVDGAEYQRILQSHEENVQIIEENGEPVLVLEKREVGKKEGYAVLQGTPDKLLHQLLEPNSIDPTFTEDFLLTYRTFISDPKQVSGQLIKWFDCGAVLEKSVAISVMSLWVSEHFADFDGNADMIQQLETFRKRLEESQMTQDLICLERSASCCSKKRSVTLMRKEMATEWGMRLVSGNERQQCNVFVSEVKEGSLAAEGDIFVGDQLLFVNAQDVSQFQLSKVENLFNDGKKMTLNVRYNIAGLRFALHPEDKPEFDGYSAVGSGHNSLSPVPRPPKPSVSGSSISKSHSGHKSLAKKIAGVLSWRGGFHKSRPTVTANTFIPPDLNEDKIDPSFLTVIANHDTSPSDSEPHSPKVADPEGVEFSFQPMTQSISMPSIHVQESKRDLSPPPQLSSNVDHVVKIFRADGGHRYIPVSNHTTASQLVALAVKEFEITESASTFALCQITANQDHLLTQKKLPNVLDKLPERLGIFSRYYLKPHSETGTVVQEDVAEEILKEGRINIHLLDVRELVRQLTLRDFETFQSIDAAEFIVDLWGCQSHIRSDHLKDFADLVNREMFWVVTEICRTSNSNQRVKLIKIFIKAARYCREARNYNTMFAILSGLGHRAVDRLKSTWDKVPSKYIRAFRDMQRLMDPTRNMSRYRVLVYGDAACPPLLPFFPVIKKDLMFMYLGNDSVVGSLVNFDKLRMLSAEVKNIKKMASMPYDPHNVFLETLVISNQQLLINSSTGTMKRRVGGGAHSSTLKRIYEQRIMERKVTEYLDSLPVYDDENILDKLSEAREPPQPVPVTKWHRTSLPVSVGNAARGGHPRTMSLSGVGKPRNHSVSPKLRRRNSLKGIQEGMGADGQRKTFTSSAVKRLSGSISPFHIRRKKGVSLSVNGQATLSNSAPVTVNRLENRES